MNDSQEGWVMFLVYGFFALVAIFLLALVAINVLRLFHFFSFSWAPLLFTDLVTMIVLFASAFYTLSQADIG